MKEIKRDTTEKNHDAIEIYKLCAAEKNGLIKRTGRKQFASDNDKMYTWDEAEPLIWDFPGWKKKNGGAGEDECMKHMIWTVDIPRIFRRTK